MPDRVTITFEFTAPYGVELARLNRIGDAINAEFPNSDSPRLTVANPGPVTYPGGIAIIIADTVTDPDGVPDKHSDADSDLYTYRLTHADLYAESYPNRRTDPESITHTSPDGVTVAHASDYACTLCNANANTSSYTNLPA